jgi:histidinol-phosphatase (PHP family)
VITKNVIKISNAHTHTNLCDGENSAAEMAEAAYRLGFGALGFSGHSFCPADGFGMDEQTLRQYCSDVYHLKELYHGDMAVYLGLELDSMSEMPPKDAFEYLIGSVHNIMAPDGQVLPVDMSAEDFAAGIDAFGGDALAYVSAYYAAVDEMLQMRSVDIVGHFDLVCKFNAGNRFFDENSPEYKEIAARVLRRHCRNFIFEINTGGMSKGYLQRPYPDYWLWEILRDEGAHVIIGTDAHSAAKVDYMLPEMTKRAVDFGLEVLTIDNICG